MEQQVKVARPLAILNPNVSRNEYLIDIYSRSDRHLTKSSCFEAKLKHFK